MSNWIAQPRPCGFAAAGPNTKSISLFKARPAPGSRKDHENKALAANELDAVGQRQNALDAVGAATQTHEQKGSLGE